MSEAFRNKHRARQSADWMLEDDGTPMGLIGPDGELYKVVTANENELTGDIEISAGAIRFATGDDGSALNYSEV